MLPIFRLIPVGGVLLAIAILLLALNPPRDTSPSVRAAVMPARGALIDRGEHPEWRQFLILAALRRAGEVESLRDLRDTVIRIEPPVPDEVAQPAQPVRRQNAGTLAGLPAKTCRSGRRQGPSPTLHDGQPAGRNRAESSRPNCRSIPHQERPPVTWLPRQRRWRSSRKLLHPRLSSQSARSRRAGVRRHRAQACRQSHRSPQAGAGQASPTPSSHTGEAKPQVAERNAAAPEPSLPYDEPKAAAAAPMQRHAVRSRRAAPSPRSRKRYPRAPQAASIAPAACRGNEAGQHAKPSPKSRAAPKRKPRSRATA